MKVGDTNRFAYNARPWRWPGRRDRCLRRQPPGTDNGQLVPMVQQAGKPGRGGHEHLTVADTGYGAGADLQAAAEKKSPSWCARRRCAAKDNPTRVKTSTTIRPSARHLSQGHLSIMKAIPARTVYASNVFVAPARLPCARPLYRRPQRPAD